MTKKRLKIREGPFRSYDVSLREVLSGVKKLLKAAGYVFLPADHIGFVQPTFRARREWSGRSNEIVGIVRSSLKKAVDGCVHLTAAHSVLGDSVEYAVVLPPINEYLFLEFLQEDGGRFRKEMEMRRFMLWMYTPAEDAIMSFVSSSADSIFWFPPPPGGLMTGLLSTRRLLQGRVLPR